MSIMTDSSVLMDPPVLDIDPYDEDVLADPYAFHESLREAAPVVMIKPHGVYAVGRHEEAKAVLSDYERFSNSAGIGLQDIRKPGDFRIPSRLLEVDPPIHTAVKSVVTRTLSPLVIRKWREGFEEKAEKRVDQLLKRSEFDGVEDCAEAFILEAFPAAVGIDLPRKEALIIGDMRFNQSGPKNSLYHRAMEKAKPYIQWFDDACDRKNVIPGSIAEMLFEAEDRGELDTGVASNVMRSFVGGGTDSTIAGLGFALHQLARHPKQWEQVRSEPGKAKAAFEEAIRFESPFQVTYRTTLKEVELNGYRLAADTKVGVFLGAAGRDPRVWQNADQYDINRPQLAGKHLSLGAGAHACIGQMIARAESEALLNALAKRVKSISLAGTPRYRLVNQMRMLDYLPLRVEPV